jgi:ADP-ribose pyrophosphatase YjhB (NUDIX family)/predicted MPP superfamily phosphohydrolase
MENRGTVTWLHLSDLHMCSPKYQWDASEVLDSLVADLKFLHREYKLEPDLLFFTGDLAFGHGGTASGLTIRDQYRDVEAFLTTIRHAVGIIPRDHVFLVPGNHDVDRRLVDEDVTKWLAKVRNPEEIYHLLRDGGTPWRECMKRLDAYREFIAEHYGHLLMHDDHLIYGRTVQVRDLRIGVAGLNSAWSCGRKQEWGKLWVGGRWQIRTLVPSLMETDLRIGLIHHPCSGWIREEESGDLSRMIAGAFDFFLHGHEHRIHVTATADGYHQVSAGACYQSSRQENAYNIVRVNLETGRGKIFLRRFEPDGGGWVPRPFYGSTNELGVWPLRNSLTKRQKEYRDRRSVPRTRRARVRTVRPPDQGAAVCYQITPAGTIELLLIRTSNHRRMFPKKYVDRGETLAEAAAHAAREEAGVTGIPSERLLGTFEHDKPEGRITIAAFLMKSQPAGHGQKDPRWYSPEAAEHALQKDRDPAEWPALRNILSEALKRIDADRI